MLGGGMRQSGILAAAGLYALKNNVNRLIEDHKNAQKLANSLGTFDGIEAEPAYTNMVFVSVHEDKRQGLIEHLRKNNVLVTGFIGSRLRLVTHKDVNEAAIDRAINCFADYFCS
jgi:threonine aldolase